MERITVKRIDTLKPGRHRADPTLFLVVEPSGSKHWIQRLTVRGERRDLGLGGYPLTTLAEARDLAWENRRTARRGGDPAPRAVRVPTFAQAAARVEAASQWRNGRTEASRRAALGTYCGGIADRRIDQIDRAAILAILSPMWIAKGPTARRLRSWLRGIFGWAQAHGHVSGNVADEIAGALPNGTATREHHPAVPYQDVAATLRAIDASGAYVAVRACLAFAVLTATRSGEARFATWGEIDETAAAWTIPANRTKTAKAHRVPLSPAALSVLESMRAFRGPAAGLIFPASGGDRALGQGAMLKALHRATGRAVTVHGFRSSFRTWASEQTSVPHAVCEAALGHAVGSDVVLSYARSDLFERRRRLMNDWADYVTRV